MNTPPPSAHPALFRDIKYHVQTEGVETKLFQQLRKKLDVRGAEYLHDPEDSDCLVIFAFSPSKMIRRSYQPSTQGKPRTLEACRQGRSNAWTLDDLRTHLGRKVGDKTKQKQFVVAAGWVDECIEKGRLVKSNRWNHWELMTALTPAIPTSEVPKTALPPATTTIKNEITASNTQLLDATLKPGARIDRTPASSKSIKRPDLFINSDVANQIVPPTPLEPPSSLTSTISTPHQNTPMSAEGSGSVPALKMAATSVKTTKATDSPVKINTPKSAGPPVTGSHWPDGVFTPLSQARQRAPQAIHVVNYEEAYLLERAIKAEGGTIDGADVAAYLLFDRTTIHLHRDLLERMGNYQVPVSIQWAKDSMRLGSIQPLDPYKITQRPAPPLQPTISIGSKRITPEATQAEASAGAQPPLKRPKTTLESSDTTNRSSAAMEQPASSNTSANGQSVPARRHSIGQKHKNTVKQRVEWKIQVLVKELAAWADNGCPTYRFTYLSTLPPLEDLKDYNNAFNSHRHEVLSRLKDRGYDVSPGSKLGGTTTSARNQARLSELGSGSRQRSKSVGPSTSSRPNAALLARASFRSSATRSGQPTAQTGADDEYDEYLS